MFPSCTPWKQKTIKDHTQDTDGLKLHLWPVFEQNFFRTVVRSGTFLDVSWNLFVIKFRIFDDYLSTWLKSLRSNPNSAWEIFFVIQIHLKFLSRHSHSCHVKFCKRDQSHIHSFSLYKNNFLRTKALILVKTLRKV